MARARTSELRHSSPRHRLPAWAWVIALAALAGACGRPGGTDGAVTVRSAAILPVVVTVKDGTGAGLAGIEVYAMDGTNSVVDQGYSDASGQVHLSVPSSTVAYHYYAQDLGTDFTTLPCTGCATVEITIDYVDVTVVDTTGAPLSGHQIAWETTAGVNGGYQSTGANGHVKMAVPPGSYTFIDQPAGFVFSSGPAGHCTAPSCTAVTITEPAPVVVTVKDTAGVAVTGAKVTWQATDNSTGATVNTNASGQATVLPPLQPVRFQATVDSTIFYSGAAGHCVQPGCTTATILVSQQTVVTLLDGSGNPVANRAVTPTSTEGITSPTKTTNTSGQATFRLPIGHWRFSAKCSGTNETFYSGDVGNCSTADACVTARIRMPCGVCASLGNGASCDDQNPCTITSTCLNHLCTPGTPMSCPGDACHDAGACSAQTGACVNPAKPNNTTCTDNNACTQGDTCQAGACVPGPAVVCPVPDQCHTAGTCNTTTGVCSNPMKPTGTACNDADACTQGDVCQADGSCHGPTAFSCAAPDQCHTAGACNTATASPQPPSTQDLIGWWRMEGDGHDASGGGHDLTVENATPAPGRFGLGMKFDGATSCMTAPAWTEAKMTGATGMTMMAWIQVDPSVGCPSQLSIMGKGWDYALGMWCPDGGGHPGVATGIRPAGAQNWGYGGPWGLLSYDGWALVGLTWDGHTAQQYINGAPVGSNVVDGTFGDVDPLVTVGCMVSQWWTGSQRLWSFKGTIDEAMLYRRPLTAAEMKAYYTASDPCVHQNVTDGTTCNDGNACTQTDSCSAGVCTGSNPKSCATPDQCHNPGTCDPGTGVCSNSIVTDGTACNDGLACTQSETCQTGSCLPPANKPLVLNRPVTSIAAGLDVRTIASGINASGQIVGYAAPSSGQPAHAFVQSASAPALDLGVPSGFSASYANSINDQGVVAGSLIAADGSFHVLRYDANGMTDLGAFSDGTTTASGTRGAVANEINAAGQIGGYFVSGGVEHGFRYTAGVGLEDIGSLAGGKTMVGALSDNGTVFGSSWVPGAPSGSTDTHAVMFDAVLGLVDLSARYGAAEGWTLFNVTDTAGDYIVGNGSLNGQQKAYRLNLWSGVLDDMSGGWQGATYANTVNFAGDVGAYASSTAGQAAYVYTDRLGFKKLNDIIDPASGWDLRVPSAINDAQEIVGWGYKSGQFSAFYIQLPTPAVASCESRSACGGTDADNICLLNDGIVRMPDNTYVALFGFVNAGASVTPTDNAVIVGDTQVANPSPAPPSVFPSGVYEAAFLPRFGTGDRVAWRVNGETVTASATDTNVTFLDPVPIGTNGWGVWLHGKRITLSSCADTVSCPGDQCHLAGACDPVTGACVNQPVADGTGCDDGDPCTVEDACSAGACKGGEPRTCTPSDQCHGTGICIKELGGCTNPALDDNSRCDDGDPCTQGDICLAGSCVSGPPVTCDAFDDCHLPGTCDQTTGVCSNPTRSDPSCTGAPPVISAVPQLPPMEAPQEIVGFDSTTGTVTVTPADDAGAQAPASKTVTIAALVGNTIECVADIDGNGANDIVFENPATGTVQYLPRLDPQQVLYGPLIAIDTTAPGGAAGPAACGDVDGDGNIDVVMSFATPDGDGATTPSLMVYRSVSGASVFQRIEVPTGFPAGVVIGGQSLADFDGDGRPDLAVYAANNQPILDSQIFVFPNGGAPADTTSGAFNLPFSSATRVSVPGTNPVASPEMANWGALTTIDGDGDGHPDLWALGTRGVLYLFRSVAGFQFAAPEFGGVLSDVGSRFTIDKLDADRDGFADLLLGSLDGSVPRIFPGGGGGTMRFFRTPNLGFPAHGILLTPKKALSLSLPTPIQGDIGLVKANPVVTTYADDKGLLHPSILMQSLEGRLVERIQQVQVTSVLVPVQVAVPAPTGMGGGQPEVMTETQRVETRTNVWSWFDHGLPHAVGNDGAPHQTVVASNPSAVTENAAGGPMLRRIFVRGLDGHLWELDQQNGTEQWVDDGLPNVQLVPGGPLVPLVGDPSAISEMFGPTPVTAVYALDAAGRLDYFRPVPDQVAWNTAGPIGGSNNCFGRSTGTLGDGSPRAISFVGSDGLQHSEVFVVNNIGELLSWRDGSWEEILDAQYTIDANVILDGNIRNGYFQNGMENVISSVKVCPNGRQEDLTCTGCGYNNCTCPDPSNPASLPPVPADGRLFEDYQYRPNYNLPFEAHGTPDVAVWKSGSTLMRAVYVRSGGGIVEYLIKGKDGAVVPASHKNQPAYDLSSRAVDSTGHGYASLTDKSVTVTTLGSGFCAVATNALVSDELISDPVVVVDSNFGELSLLSTSINHWLTIGHRPLAKPASWQWERRPMSLLTEPDYTNAIAGSPGAIPVTGGAPLPTGPSSGGAPVPVVDVPAPSLDIFAIRSTGILTEANSTADATSNWKSCDAVAGATNQAAAQKACPAQLSCTAAGIFKWLLDPATSHAPANAPAIVNNTAAFTISPPGEGNFGEGCRLDTIVNTIMPQWVSPQRQNQAYRGPEYGITNDNSVANGPPYAKGFDDEVLVEIEGVVLDSHISSLDMPIDHTHGTSKEDIPIVHHDWNIIIAPDVKYQKLLTDANILEGGKMELEWEMSDHFVCTEHDSSNVFCTKRELSPGDPATSGITDADLPAIGDRVAVRGRFIFDCGHPPYRTEIHPIDAIAVIRQGSDDVKYRVSPHGGSTWFQPGDVNLQSGWAVKEQDILLGLLGKLTSKPNVSGWGPFDDLVADIDQVEKILGDVDFLDNGCTRHYDTDIIRPATTADETDPPTPYYPYEHAINDRFASIPPTAQTAPTTLFPWALPLNTDFGFVIPGTTDTKFPPLPEAPFQSDDLYGSTTPARHFQVCFQRTTFETHEHSNPSPDAWELIHLRFTCDVDDQPELVTYLTANDKVKIYEEGKPNCLDVKLYPGNTLQIGSHGYECDLSCGERWDDSFSASPDDRIGRISAAFTSDQNFGAPGNGFSGSYTLRSQPDLATKISRTATAGDYQMVVTIRDSDASP